MTCRASPSMSFSVFMPSLLASILALELAISCYHHSRSDQGTRRSFLSNRGQDCYNRQRNERVNPRRRSGRMRLNDEAQRAFSVQDYGAQPRIQGVEIVELKRFADDGGGLHE